MPSPDASNALPASHTLPALEQLPLTSRSGMAVLAATIIGSSMAFIDASIVNLALPAISDDLNGTLSSQTWVVNAYNLTLASLILVGGALSDRHGHLRVFIFGIIWFSVASAVCAIAPTIETLVVARAGQGIGSALLTPASLALLQATIRPEDRGKAIGLWSGLTGVAAALGPLVGGVSLAAGSWRTVFLINVPLGAVVLAVAMRSIPRHPGSARPTDWIGSSLLVLGLAELSYGLTRWADHSFTSPSVLGTIALSVCTLALFGIWQFRVPAPLLPPDVWSSRSFVWINAVTLLIYGALAGVFLWLVVHLQAVVGASALVSGLSLLPITVLMLAFSPWAGAWATRSGPRMPMTLGPLVAALAVAWLSRIGSDASYVIDVLLPVTLLGIGLTITVTPLTTAALAALPTELAGVASGANNAVARTGGLLSIAALPVLSRLGSETDDRLAATQLFSTAMLACAALLGVAAVISALLVPSRKSAPAVPPPNQLPKWHCAATHPPLARSDN